MNADVAKRFAQHEQMVHDSLNRVARVGDAP